MEPIKLLDREFRELLSSRAEILQHWREQEPSLGNRVKNFENWLLVELVNRLRIAGAAPIKTNGFLPGWRPSYWSRSGRFTQIQKYLRKNRLEGRKSAVKSLNPDLAFATGRDATPMNVEIKTQMSPKDVFTDLLIVKCHNDLENRKTYRALCPSPTSSAGHAMNKDDYLCLVWLFKDVTRVCPRDRRG